MKLERNFHHGRRKGRRIQRITCTRDWKVMRGRNVFGFLTIVFLIVIGGIGCASKADKGINVVQAPTDPGFDPETSPRRDFRNSKSAFASHHAATTAESSQRRSGRSVARARHAAATPRRVASRCRHASSLASCPHTPKSLEIFFLEKYFFF